MLNSRVGGRCFCGTYGAPEEGERFAIRVPTAARPPVLYRPPVQQSSQLHVFLSVQIEDQSLEFNRHPVRVVWGVLFSGFFSILVFFFFFALSLGEAAKSGLRAAAGNREPEVVLVGLLLFLGLCCRAAPDRPRCSPSPGAAPPKGKLSVAESSNAVLAAAPSAWLQGWLSFHAFEQQAEEGGWQRCVKGLKVHQCGNVQLALKKRKSNSLTYIANNPRNY